MNNLLAANVGGLVVEEIAERDGEVGVCTAQLEQLKRQRTAAKEGHHRAMLDAVIQNVRSQLEYVIERRRVRADIRRYEYERRLMQPSRSACG
jgi:hypothetical protein